MILSCLQSEICPLLTFGAVHVAAPRWVRTQANKPSPPVPPNRDGDTGTVTAVKTRVKKPSRYKVLLLNDDYTPMEFVVHILQYFFEKSVEDATTIMLHVHQNGVGVCGVFTYEVAETKVIQVVEHARRFEFPLQCVLEKE